MGHMSGWFRKFQLLLQSVQNPQETKLFCVLSWLWKLMGVSVTPETGALGNNILVSASANWCSFNIFNILWGLVNQQLYFWEESNTKPQWQLSLP